MPLAPPGPVTPGVYPGGGQARLLRMGEQQYLCQANAMLAGQLSIAVLLDRPPRISYPWGAAVQIQFSGAPGTFEVDLVASETDESSSSYVAIGTALTAVNSSNFGRIELPDTIFPKFVALLFKTFPNAINTTAIITR